VVPKARSPRDSKGAGINEKVGGKMKNEKEKKKKKKSGRKKKKQRNRKKGRLKVICGYR
jgi:hypothetical protein